ncbi:hypothetical protein [Streptacidiphilus cavernicola]|uniref:Uncharacterized protein n=1 Tax=Streptacidiphilus cavernicola TaxID=3342716 RepID=A0ABV6W583_9ACTN
MAGLCRRDGCTRVQVVGGAGDNGADVRGLLHDGRSFEVGTGHRVDLGRCAVAGADLVLGPPLLVGPAQFAVRAPQAPAYQDNQGQESDGE